METHIWMESPQIRCEQELPQRVGEMHETGELEEGRNGSQRQMLKRIHNGTEKFKKKAMEKRIFRQ